DLSRRVKAVTELGPGYWLMVPLVTREKTVWINRGFLPSGLTDAEIDAIMSDPDSGALDPKERAVVDYADQVALTNPDGLLTEERIKALQDHFSSAEICELGTVMAIISGMAKLTFVMDLVEKEQYCTFANAS
ncbi:MAG: SURF1 family cytochrome oxidase biogenesis protein, partial [Pseudomonadota bacterium]